MFFYYIHCIYYVQLVIPEVRVAIFMALPRLVLTVSRLCYLLGGLRGPAQPGAPRLRCGVDHRHQFAGGIPHLLAAGGAAVEGESGDHGCLQTSQPGHQFAGLPRAREPGKRFPLTVQVQMESAPSSGRGWNLASSWTTLEKESSITSLYLSSEN